MGGILQRVSLSGVIVNGEEFEGPVWLFYCPGCQAVMWFPATFGFNGDLERPVLARPLYTRSHVLVSGRPRTKRTKHQCDLLMNDGRLTFSDQCTHPLAGQTVDMVPFRWSEDDSDNRKLLATD